MTISKYKVCILAAGPSRRVGDYSENVHKAVLPVGPDHLVACWRAAEGEISPDDFERTRIALET